tara:strand:- start:469 stop:1173 length:705 start_codon:yes stop_codon:yes gene_type:complete
MTIMADQSKRKWSGAEPQHAVPPSPVSPVEVVKILDEPAEGFHRERIKPSAGLLKDLRTYLKFNMREMALALEISTGHYCNLERGVSAIPKKPRNYGNTRHLRERIRDLAAHVSQHDELPPEMLERLTAPAPAEQTVEQEPVEQPAQTRDEVYEAEKRQPHERLTLRCSPDVAAEFRQTAIDENRRQYEVFDDMFRSYRDSGTPAPSHRGRIAAIATAAAAAGIGIGIALAPLI